MKENIDSKNVGNRKFIIELRFEPKVSMLDKRGLLVEKLQECKVFPVSHWEIGQSDVTVRDSKNREDAINVATVTFNRLNFISYNIASVESFYAKFTKIYDAVLKVLDDLTITRIGCRIIGSYYTSSKDYETIVSNFKNSFPSKFLIEKYPVKDFMFNLVYNNGMYQIGPLSDNDNFYDREFAVPGCKKHVGVCIDTDNYLTNDSMSINERSLIKDVYTLSLSVEKELLSNLAEF